MRSAITIMALAMVLTAEVANAAPAYLSCTGMTAEGSASRVSKGGKPETHKDVVAITIDISASTITVEGTLYQITHVSDQMILVAVHQGVMNVDINLDRLTGKLDFGVTTKLKGEDAFVHTFDGFCKPTPLGS